MNPLVDIRYIAWFIWLSFSVFSIMYIAGLSYKPVKSNTRARVFIVIVSIASNSVRNSLYEAINNVRSLGLPFTVLVDENSELIGELEANGIPLTIVPNGYRHDLTGKGRAINYFIENHVRGDIWYAFIDDDNLILDIGFMYEIPYYESKGYVACNPVLVPRKGRSNIAFVMDWIRYFDDLSVFRFSLGFIHRPFVGMHGELLCVKGSVLREIGFGFHSITEDFRFAGELVRHGYKTWQTSTRVSIKSPNSIGDFVRQRSRWFKGIVHDLPSTPLPMSVIVLLRMVMWTLGILGSWLLSPLWLLWGSYIPAIPGAIAYWSVYTYGSLKLGKPQYILLAPLYGIIDALSWVKAPSIKNFVVIDKN